MKITLITSNKNRHNYLINLLGKYCDELFVIQECATIFPGIVPHRYPASDTMKKYFLRVNDAQIKFFGNPYVNSHSSNIKILPILMGDLKHCSLSFLSDFLKSDLYIIFGCSYIKGKLIDYLVEKKAINIHMGVSPYYRGADCNFWALNDNNPHLVGATIHLISKGLDDGPILFHALSNLKNDPFEYTMSTVKAAFQSIAIKIKDKSILKTKPLDQNKDSEIRYSKLADFNEKIVKDFLLKDLNLNSKKIDISLLKDPYFLTE